MKGPGLRNPEYRILEKDGKFYPQKYCEYWFVGGEYRTIQRASFTKTFMFKNDIDWGRLTLDEAVNDIDNYKKQINPSPEIIHPYSPKS